MCKIVTFTNLNKVNNIDKLIKVVSKNLLQYEKDGFGYAIHGEHGVFGERMCNTTQYKSSWGKKQLDRKWLNSNRNLFGIKSKIKGAGIFHGRTSTNDVNLLNTHPIVKDDQYLIHNGVVTNNGPEYKQFTTNDTEHLLHYLTTTGIEGVEQYLSGYYAVSMLGSDGDLVIFRDSIAPLYCAEVVELGNELIFATTETLIEDICLEMNWTYSSISKLNDNTYLKFSKGELVEVRDINPLGYTKNETKHSKKSLGTDFDTYDSYNKTKQDFKLYSNDDLIEFSEDEEQFLEETTKYSDHTYTFLDYRGNSMDRKEYMMLSTYEKLYCTVIRPDGTICDPNDYYTDKLWSGAI